MRLKHLIEIVRFEIKSFYQKMTRGVSDVELWNLDNTIAQFILPRLRKFVIRTGSYPAVLDEEYDDPFAEWQRRLYDIIYAMEYYSKIRIGREGYDMERVDRGVKYLGEHFHSLWW